MQLAADELGPSWVRVNSIRPGLIRTDMVAPITDSPELSEDYRACTPLPRVGEAEDIANMAMFLLSDAAGWVTGQVSTSTAGICSSRPGLQRDARAGVRCRRPTRSGLRLSNLSTDRDGVARSGRSRRTIEASEYRCGCGKTG